MRWIDATKELPKTKCFIVCQKVGYRTPYVALFDPSEQGGMRFKNYDNWDKTYLARVPDFWFECPEFVWPLPESAP